LGQSTVQKKEEEEHWTFSVFVFSLGSFRICFHEKSQTHYLPQKNHFKAKQHFLYLFLRKNLKINAGHFLYLFSRKFPKPLSASKKSF
jgi:hypothetical protein